MVNIEESTVETTTETTNTVDIETLQAQLKEAEEKNKTLWDKIYKLKKENKAPETPEAWLSTEAMEKFYKDQKFYEANPTMSEHKADINELTSNGKLSNDEAMEIVMRRNPDIVARQNTQNGNFTAWTPNYWTNSYSMKQLAEIWKENPHKYAGLMRDYKAGKIKVI